MIKERFDDWIMLTNGFATVVFEHLMWKQGPSLLDRLMLYRKPRWNTIPVQAHDPGTLTG